MFALMPLLAPLVHLCCAPKPERTLPLHSAKIDVLHSSALQPAAHVDQRIVEGRVELFLTVKMVHLSENRS